MSKYKYKYSPGILEGLYYMIVTVDDKNEKLFEEMGKNGYRLVEFNWLRGWKFEQAPPGEYTYSIDINDDTDPSWVTRSPQMKSSWVEYEEIFVSGGWEYVCSKSGCHIFRAPKGTRPIYTDNDGLAEKYAKQRTTYIWQLFVNLLGGIFCIALIWYNSLHEYIWGAFGGLGAFCLFMAGITGCKALNKHHKIKSLRRR